MDSISGGVGFELVSRRLGALPLVNHFLERSGLPALLERYLPVADARARLSPAVAVRLVITNLLVGRQPLYGLGEWADRFDPGLLGLGPDEAGLLNDDRVGRALEALFDADRASLLTELMLGVVAEFGVDTGELHNDSTSISVPGSTGTRPVRRAAGKPTPQITFGHSKDHRPDLKQLVLILTVAADGAVPIAYRLADGNTTDDPTHVPTWDRLVGAARAASTSSTSPTQAVLREAMGHIAAAGGRFVTVLPRSRSEDPGSGSGPRPTAHDGQRPIRRPGSPARRTRPGVLGVPRAAALGGGLPRSSGCTPPPRPPPMPPPARPASRPVPPPSTPSPPAWPVPSAGSRPASRSRPRPTPRWPAPAPPAGSATR